MAVFGVRVSGVDLVASSRVWAETWIIAAGLGTTALGLFNISQRLVQVAQELAAASLTPVSTVVFARVRESRTRLGTTYLKALGLAYAVVSPLMVLIVVTGPVLIPTLFGHRWQSSVLPAQALAVAGIITLGAMLDHGLYYGLGRPGAWLSYSVVVDAVTVATTAVAVRWGLGGVAVGFVGVAVLATVVRWLLVARVVGLPVVTVARPFATVLVPTVATMLIGTLLLRSASGIGSEAATLVVTVVGTLLVNLVLLRLFAARTIGDGLMLVPLPTRYAARLHRLLRLVPRPTP
jgi:O-antigen/teichoic acid export membrane protein